MGNQQLRLKNEQSSTTISQESTGSNATGKRPVYLKEKNVIYKITNIINNKIYIGSAAYYDKRIGDHVSNLRKGKHHNKHLQFAWNKYNENNFVFEILEKVDCKENLRDREQYYIDLYRPFDPNIGYNLCKLAERNRFGMKMPESAKIKIGNFWRGKKHSEERKAKLKLNRTLQQGKTVIVYDKNFNYICEFCSMAETARQLNVSIGSVSLHCAGKRKNGLKYNFRYKDIV